MHQTICTIVLYSKLDQLPMPTITAGCKVYNLCFLQLKVGRFFLKLCSCFYKKPYSVLFFKHCKLKRGGILLLCLMLIYFYYSWSVYQSTLPMTSYCILISRGFKHILIILIFFLKYELCLKKALAMSTIWILESK